MGYYVRRRNGEDVFFEDNVPEPVALARVRQMDGAEGVGSGNFFGDLNEYLQEGIGGVGAAIGEGITFLDPTARDARARGDVPIGDQLAQASRNYAREFGTDRLSPEALEARYRDNPIYSDEEGINWRNIVGTTASSAPYMAASVATGGTAGILGASPRVSGGIASATEGALAGGSVADAIDESIRDIAASDPQTFISSPVGQAALRRTNGNYAQAVELAANDAKDAAPLIAGVVTAALGRVGGNWFSPSGRQTIARAALSGGMREAAEEALQSGNEQIATNYGVGQVDPETGLLDDVPEAMAMGALTAAPAGAAFGAGHQVLSRLRPPPGPAQPAGPAVQGPVMPPPGHPNAGPASGNGNPPGWQAPSTDGAEDADYREPGDFEITGPPSARPRGWKKGTESWAEVPPEPEAGPDPAEARAEEYAARFDGEEPITDPADDEFYADTLTEQFRSLGMAARDLPQKKGHKRFVQPVPLYKFNREALEADDEDAASIYAGAVADGRSISETATFGAYSQAEQSLFADEEGDPGQAAGFGLKVVDVAPDGAETVSYLDIGANSLAEAEASANKFGTTRDQGATAQPQKAEPKPPEEIKPQKEAVVEPEAPQTGTAVEPKGPIKNLKPAASEALKAFRTDGEQGLLSYLGGMNITAAKSLLKNLGGQVGRTDDINKTKGAITLRVRQLAKSADARGLPESSAPVVNDNVDPVDEAANQAVSDEEFFGKDWPANTKVIEGTNANNGNVSEQGNVTDQEQTTKPTLTVKEALKDSNGTTRSVMGETDAFATRRPSRDGGKKERKEDPDIVELPKRESRSPNQIKALLRDVAALEDDAYDRAVAKLKITPEEAAAVREVMKTDKGLDNLRSTFNDALASQRATKKSRQTDAPKTKPKAEVKKKEESPERVAAKVKKQRDTADKALAKEMARGQPANYETVRKAVEDWLEMERERSGARTDESWFKRWPLGRQEELIRRTWDYVNGRGPMESRKYGQGANMPYDLNPLMLFSRAERMANSFPEDRSTRMHMLRWLEKRVRKPELKFIDMSDFLKGGATGNPLVDKATKQELIDYIKGRKLRLTVSTNFGKYSDIAAKFSEFTNTPYGNESLNGDLSDRGDDNGAPLTQYAEYSLLGEDVINHNAIEVGIVIEPGQPGSDGRFSHIGPKGTIAAFIASDLPGVEIDGKEVRTFVVHQGQSDYHDAKSDQYIDLFAKIKSKKKKAAELRSRIKEIWPRGRPLEFRSSGFDENGLKTIAVSNPGDLPGDTTLSSATGVGGRGLTSDVIALVRELEELGRMDYELRDINAPYRDTHPELMFRTAFMMAVSSGHKALAWPTAETIRKYQGHSTYKGDFYDKRWPAYAEAWLKEWKPRIIKQEYDSKIEDDIEFREEVLGSLEDELDNWMGDEAQDIKGNVRSQIIGPRGSDPDAEDFLEDFLEGLRGALMEKHYAWFQQIENTPGQADAARQRQALVVATTYATETDDIPSGWNHDNVYAAAEKFAKEYANRFSDVYFQAKDATTAEEKPKTSSKAEIYVMPITDEMRQAFLSTGAPMFSRSPEAAERPIQARDVPIQNKKWVNEMERAIKTAAACAASLGPAGVGAGVTMAAGLGLGGLASVPIAALIAEEGSMITRVEGMMDQVREFRREAGLAPANAYLNEDMNYEAPSYDEDGFIEPSAPDDEVYSAAELAAAREEIMSISGTNIPSSMITPADVRRQAYIRRYGLRRHINDLNAPSEPREEERIRIPQ